MVLLQIPGRARIEFGRGVSLRGWLRCSFGWGVLWLAVGLRGNLGILCS